MRFQEQIQGVWLNRQGSITDAGWIGTVDAIFSNVLTLNGSRFIASNYQGKISSWNRFAMNEGTLILKQEDSESEFETFFDKKFQ